MVMDRDGLQSCVVWTRFPLICHLFGFSESPVLIPGASHKERSKRGRLALAQRDDGLQIVNTDVQVQPGHLD